jgi:hypothetical protein
MRLLDAFFVTQAVLTLVSIPAAADLQAARVIPTGEPFVMWNTLNSSCEKKSGPIDLPDTPARAFVDESTGETVLITVDSTSRLSRGMGLLNTSRNCPIVWNSTGSRDPALYATNDGFLDAVHSFGNGTVVALLHDEYPGMNYNNCNIVPFVWPGCWTVSMSLAVSQDWGRTWAHSAPPPSNLVAAVPYPYQPSGNVIFGWGDSGGITPHPSDGFFYVAVNNRMAFGLQSNGTCVMRSDSLLDPHSWRAWNGSAFSVPFVSAYASPPVDAREHICTVLEPFMPTPCTVLGTTFSSYLFAFVATISCWHDAQPGPNDPNFYWTTSVDFVHWSPAQVLFRPPSPPGTQFYLYPALLDAEAPGRGDYNYATIGQNATLTYVRVTSSLYQQGRQLMGVNLTFFNLKNST